MARPMLSPVSYRNQSTKKIYKTAICQLIYLKQDIVLGMPDTCKIIIENHA